MAMEEEEEWEWDIENPLGWCNEERDAPSSIAFLFCVEADHMPSSSSSSSNSSSSSSSRNGHPLLLHLPFRRSTVDLILQAVSLGTVDHTVAYLAINYLDRYIARRGSPSDKEWFPGFVAVSCLSIASKMMHPTFSLLRFLRDTNSWFAAETVGRMEKLILSALEWRTRSITPFAFLRYFLASYSAPSSHFHHSVVRKRAIAIFTRAQRGTRVMGYKPSVVAAASLLSAASDLFPAQFPPFHSAVRACILLNKDTLEACFDALEEDKARGAQPPR